MISSTDAAIADWLARAHKFPLRAHAEWAERSVAMLPLGRRFDAVRIHAGIVHAAAGSEDREAVAGFLGELLHGPVIHDPHGEFYVLVPPQTTETWSSPLARCLGRGSWMGVPRTGQAHLSFGPYWAVPMERAGDLCSPHAGAELVRLGHQRLTEVTG
ncbi:hypothetical protein [Streptomyces sp. ISL-100]|uniref:hypothetical protein n=1 Tax=Streptomyces sp. ISL-100 TaxID=2819173 RepID=UPI001BEC728D|nr:hypothetical protein [Streptomyces sp. ISL-100]MBT2401467.1 hypothetical protein [Streptomyces sp. ISL-100]